MEMPIKTQIRKCKITVVLGRTNLLMAQSHKDKIRIPVHIEYLKLMIVLIQSN